jgi:hypothetical protein
LKCSTFGSAAGIKLLAHQFLIKKTIPTSDGIAILISQITIVPNSTAIGLLQILANTKSEIPLRTAKSKNGNAGEID